jgi:hypothetical protein
MKGIGTCILTLFLFGSVGYTGDESTRARNFPESVHVSSLKERLGVRSNATAVEGYSFVTFIPFVTRAQNTRTNLGLNNISRDSVVKGSNPVANVHIFLVDSGGFPAGEGDYVVQSNELLQINDVMTALHGDVDTGWLLMFSDEPLEAWASVIFNDTNDPSIEIGERSAYARLLIPSTVKTDAYQSSLVLVNVGSGRGEVVIKIFDQKGTLLTSKSVFIDEFGTYVDPDIRSSVSGTFGEIIVEARNPSVFLIGSSIVKSSNGTGAFFPAVPLPPETLTSVAGVWKGNLTGTLNNAQVELSLLQEQTSLFGTLKIVSGIFATGATSLSVSGSVAQSGTTQRYFLRAANSFDGSGNFYSFHLYAPQLNASKLEGSTLYLDEKGARETGTFSLTRTGSIIVP